jgi:acetyltransferase
MVRFADNLRALYETPVPRGGDDGQPAEVTAVIDGRAAEGRTLLDEAEAKAVLARYGIPVVPTRPRAMRTRRSRPRARSASRSRSSSGRGRHHAQDRRRRRQAGAGRRSAVGRAFDDIRAAVAKRRAGAAFLGVTVQPMIDRAPARADPGSSSSIASSVRC